MNNEHRKIKKGEFDKKGIHLITGEKWDEQGFDKWGDHKSTGLSYNEKGVDRWGKKLKEKLGCTE